VDRNVTVLVSGGHWKKKKEGTPKEEKRGKKESCRGAFFCVRKPRPGKGKRGRKERKRRVEKKERPPIPSEKRREGKGKGRGKIR